MSKEAAAPQRPLHRAEFGGVVVVQRADDGELPGMLVDRTWLAARVLGDPRAAMRGLGPDAVLRLSRVWACWAHLGCEYDAATMAEVRRVHGCARTVRACSL